MNAHPDDPHADRDDLDEEVAFHVEMQMRRYVEAGLDPAEARARALARLGDLDRARRDVRSIAHAQETGMRRTVWFHDLRHDFTYAARTLRRAPAFAATAALTIAIGIGANTAIFSAVNAVLIEGVPYPNADRLAMVWNSYGGTGLSQAAVAAAEFADIKDTRRAFDGVAAIGRRATTLAGSCGATAACEPERVTGYAVSSDLFTLLGVAPAVGRPFVDADGATGAARVVLLGDAIWRLRFGADPDIVGRTVDVGAIPHTVIGVMPAGVRFPDAPVGFLEDAADLWVPFNWEQSRSDGRGNQFLGVLTRRQPNVTIEQAQADLDRIADAFKAAFPDRYAGATRQWRLSLVPLRDQMVGDVRPALLTLLAISGLVLLIACANVANLMLARGSARRKELAIRSALGARRGRIVRQLAVEAAVVAGLGGLAGIALASFGVRGLQRIAPADIPLLGHTSVDQNVLFFSIGVTVLTAFAIGLVPAIRQSGIDAGAAMNDGSRGGSAGSSRRRVRSALVVVEVTLAAIVLVAAGLLLRSFSSMTRVEPGFRAAQVAAAEVTLPGARYAGPRIPAFHVSMVGGLLALPGVTSASGIYPLPMSGNRWSGTLVIEDTPALPGQPEAHAEYAMVLPDYFRTMAIPLVEGRDFTDRDIRGAPRVAIVDERLARMYWPGESAVGKHLSAFGPPTDNNWTTVVGVVGHVRNSGPRDEGEPQVYRPALQGNEPALTYVARTSAGVEPLPAAMRGVVRAIDPALAAGRVNPMTDVVARATARDRFNTLLLAIFGGVALAIAAIGLYGVLAFLVTERTREIAIRLALGGRPAGVLASVLVDGARLTAAGLVAGLMLSLALSQTISGLLFGIDARDPLTYVSIALLFFTVALIASYLPARRAMRVDPGSVLKA